MQRSRSLISRPLYVILTWVIAGAFIVMVPGKNLWKDYQKQAAKQQAEAITVEQGTARIIQIRNAALAKNKLTASEYAKTVVDIRALERRMDKTLSDEMTGIDKLVGITVIRGNETRQFGSMGLGTAILREDEKRYGRPDVVAGIVNSLWVGCWFIPCALLILMLRVATVARSWTQFRAMVSVNELEIVGASLFWGVGLGVYQPGHGLLTKITRLGYRAEDDTAIDWAAKRQAALELINRGQLGAVSPFRAIGALLKVVWGGSWRQASFGTRFHFAKQAAYVSVMGTLMILCGAMRAYATDGSGLVLQRITFSYNKTLGLTGPPSENLFLDFKGGVSAIIFGYSSPAPVLELSKATTELKIGGLNLSVGPYVDYSLDTGKVTAYGATGFASTKLGNATLGGPVYLTVSPQGTVGFNAPNTRLIWKVGSKYEAGLGMASSFQEGKSPSILVGPVLHLKEKWATFRLRLGQVLTGPSKGQNTIRVDFSFAR